MNEQDVTRVEIWNDTQPPYNYYQIYKIYSDGSPWRLATVDAELYGIVDQIAEKIANYYDVTLMDRREIRGRLING